jgi:large subunit ribosomal protein L3
MKAILGEKQEMTQLYDTESGAAIPCTIIDVNDVSVASLKTQERDGYSALVLGRGETSREVRLEEDSDLKKGTAISADVFSEGDEVQVTGVTKGKGFQGVVRKFGFAGGPKTHGQSDRHRAPGSIGAGTTPGRVWKGKKMPGRMGGEKRTVKGMKVIKVIKDKGLVCVSGSVPGGKRGLVVITEMPGSDESRS